MLQFLFSALSGGMFDKVANVITTIMVKRSDERTIHMQTLLANNALKAQANGWWGAKCIILAAGLPMAAHMGAIALDTLIPPFGSWGIPKLPPPYDTYQWAIVQSFFLVMPAMTVASGVANWLQRK